MGYLKNNFIGEMNDVSYKRLIRGKLQEALLLDARGVATGHAQESKASGEVFEDKSPFGL